MPFPLIPVLLLGGMAIAGAGTTAVVINNANNASKESIIASVDDTQKPGVIESLYGGDGSSLVQVGDTANPKEFVYIIGDGNSTTQTQTTEQTGENPLSVISSLVIPAALGIAGIYVLTRRGA